MVPNAFQRRASTWGHQILHWLYIGGHAWYRGTPPHFNNPFLTYARRPSTWRATRTRTCDACKGVSYDTGLLKIEVICRGGEGCIWCNWGERTIFIIMMYHDVVLIGFMVWGIIITGCIGIPLIIHYLLPKKEHTARQCTIHTINNKHNIHDVHTIQRVFGL